MQVHSAGAEGHRRIRQLDGQHRIYSMKLSFKLRTFVGLIGWNLRELLCNIGPSLLQLLGDGKEATILRGLPKHDIVVRDYWNRTTRKDLVSTGVIEMVVGIERVFDRLFCLCAYRID